MKRKLIIISIFSVIVIIISIFIIANKKELQKLNKIFVNKEKLEDDTSMIIKRHSSKGNDVSITVIFKNPSGISKILYPNQSMEINCNGKEKIAIDYTINKQDTYTFDIISDSGIETQKEIKFSEINEPLPSPTIIMWPNLNTVKKGRQITFTAQIEGYEDNGIYYIWQGREKETSTYEVGTHTVMVKAVDENNNESEWVSKTFSVIDMEVPHLNIELIPSNNFNILGNGNKTTYNNAGYSTILLVDGKSTSVVRGKGSINNVNCTTNVSIIEDGNYAKIEYVITNNSMANKTVSIATHADIMINNDDRARIDNLPGNKGFIMTDGTLYYNVILRGQEGITDVDSYWFGRYNDRTNNLWNDSHPQSLVNTDSGMVYSWKNKVIEPGETKSFIVKIGLE